MATKKSKQDDKREVPTKPADINETHREFWGKVQRNVDIALKNPRMVEDAMSELKRSAIANEVAGISPQAAFKTMPSLNGILDRKMNEASASFKERQRANQAPKRQRPRGIREVVIDAMKLARRDDKSLSDFLAAAVEGSIQGIDITSPAFGAGGKYTVSCDECGDKEIKAAEKTLQGWWKKAEGN